MKLPVSFKRKLVKNQLGIDLNQKMFYEIGHLKGSKERVLLRFYSEPLSMDEMKTIWEKMVQPMCKKPFSHLLLHKEYVANTSQLEKIEPVFIESLKVYDYFKNKDYKVITVKIDSLKFNEFEGDFTFEIMFKGVRVWD